MQGKLGFVVIFHKVGEGSLGALEFREVARKLGMLKGRLEALAVLYGPLDHLNAPGQRLKDRVYVIPKLAQKLLDLFCAQELLAQMPAQFLGIPFCITKGTGVLGYEVKAGLDKPVPPRKRQSVLIVLEFLQDGFG